MVDTIIFDLDGTLLPIDQDEFVNAYFKLLVQKIAPLGYTKDQIVNGIWTGTGAMQKNDGTITNSQRFWKTFIGLLGDGAASLESTIDEFYATEFNQAKVCLRSKPDRRPLIEDLKKQGFSLVLASNPVFPLVAMNSRLSWIGLSIDDFDYVTHYENSSFCKPSLGYYSHILHEIGKDGEECIMVGNNPIEDGAITELGADFFLVTDIIEGGCKDTEYRSGSFETAQEYLLSL